MQKKLIALAVAGLASGAAFAQTNVTIYGVMDAGYVYSSGERPGNNTENANFSGIQSGVLAGSRIGFKGEEALGNGLKAVFVAEYGIGIDTNGGIGNTGGLNSRQTYVGLNHAKLGTVALGRQYAPAFGAMVRNDAFVASDAASPIVQMNRAAGNTIYAASPARIDNSVSYTSPNWSGFTVSGIYGFGENAAATLNGSSGGNDGFFGAGLNYANGPLNLDLVYQTRQGRNSNAIVATQAAGAGLPAIAGSVATRDSTNEWMIGGSYDFKVVKVFASYQDQNDNNGNSTTEASNRAWQVGVTVPVFGNGKVHVAYADLEWDRKNSGGSDAWAVGYTHALSKRTTLYTTYTYTDNDKSAPVAAGAVANTRFRGESNTVFAAGISHSF